MTICWLPSGMDNTGGFALLVAVQAVPSTCKVISGDKIVTAGGMAAARRRLAARAAWQWGWDAGVGCGEHQDTGHELGGGGGGCKTQDVGQLRCSCRVMLKLAGMVHHPLASARGDRDMTTTKLVFAAHCLRNPCAVCISGTPRTTHLAAPS